ncbi:hypothetical protein KKG45_00075, partial [bacterium]|nr:hypothetical protein [bacterium]
QMEELFVREAESHGQECQRVLAEAARGTPQGLREFESGPVPKQFLQDLTQQGEESSAGFLPWLQSLLERIETILDNRPQPELDWREN